MTGGATVEVHHRFFARLYPRVAATANAHGGAEHRNELLVGLSGRVVEIGAGHGVNFAHYPASVVEVTAVEPEAELRRLAERAAIDAPIPVTVVSGVAEHLPLETGAFDAAVLSLVMCSLRDVSASLAEVHRVLRPGGELRFYENVHAATPGLARAQRIADVVWPLLAGGCHTSRDSVASIAAAGFEITSCRAFSFKAFPLDILVKPHVIGTARRKET